MTNETRLALHNAFGTDHMHNPLVKWNKERDTLIGTRTNERETEHIMEATLCTISLDKEGNIVYKPENESALSFIQNAVSDKDMLAIMAEINAHRGYEGTYTALYVRIEDFSLNDIAFTSNYGWHLSEIC